MPPRPPSPSRTSARRAGAAPSNSSLPLAGKVALVAGATRGAGRGIAVALGESGATVYCSGRSTRESASPLARPETIDETAELVTAAGGTGIAVRCDHTVDDDVAALVARIAREQDGRLDVLVNDVWGGDAAGDWLWKPLHETDVDAAWRLVRQAVQSHHITSRHALPLMIARRAGLVVEVTDGDTLAYRGAFFYDFIKTAVMRTAFAMSVELAPHRVTALAITPGFLRSEAMLEHFGVKEENWRDGVKVDRHFIASETPALVGRSVAALAADRRVARFNGQTLSSWEVARAYALRDVDGTRPDWLAHFRARIPRSHVARKWMQAALGWEASIRDRTRRFLR